MAAQPVQPVNYAQILMQGLTAGLGSYQQISQIERQERKDTAADEERIFKERVGLAAQVHNKHKSQQVPALEAHIRRIFYGFLAGYVIVFIEYHLFRFLLNIIFSKQSIEKNTRIILWIQNR